MGRRRNGNRPANTHTGGFSAFIHHVVARRQRPRDIPDVVIPKRAHLEYYLYGGSMDTKQYASQSVFLENGAGQILHELPLGEARAGANYDRECFGIVNDVVFPTGIGRCSQSAYDVYYGAADAQISLANFQVEVR